MATKKQKMVGFGTSVKRFWTKYFTFSGVAQRSEYWFAVLFVFLLWYLLSFCVAFLGVWAWLICVATFIPFISLAARRLHDIGVSAKWLWLLSIPGAAFVCFLITLPMALAVSFMYYTPAHEIYIVRNDIAGLVFFVSFVLTSVPMFIATLLPSKLKNNRYRK